MTLPDGRHIGMHAMESSRPYFLDEIVFKLPPFFASMDLPIDPVYLGTIEPDSLCVIQCSEPKLGAQIVSGRLRVTASVLRLQGIRGVVTIAGIRRGFKDWHYQPYTAEQFMKNNAFYSAAYG